MSGGLFSEHEADKEIIESLIKANRTLWRELEHKRAVIQSLTDQLNRRQGMSKIVKTTDGAFYRVEDEQQLTADDVQAKLNECQAEANALQALLAPPEPAQPEAPADAPTQPAAPADAPVDSSAQPAAPEAPTADPGAAPAEQAAPAADPNAALPEQPAAPADPSVVPPLQ